MLSWVYSLRKRKAQSVKHKADLFIVEYKKAFCIITFQICFTLYAFYSSYVGKTLTSSKSKTAFL